MEQSNGSVVLYTTEDGKTQLDVKLENQFVPGTSDTATENCSQSEQININQ